MLLLLYIYIAYKMDTTKFLRVSKKRTLATNRTVENNKKTKGRKLRREP